MVKDRNSKPAMDNELFLINSCNFPFFNKYGVVASVVAFLIACIKKSQNVHNDTE